jgi:hypothetical protein
MAALGLLMAEGSGLRVNSDKWEGAATAQKLCYGYAAASSRYARRDLRCAFTELLRGVDVCLILDQFGELITCPIQEGDGAAGPYHPWVAPPPRGCRDERGKVSVRLWHPAPVFHHSKPRRRGLLRASSAAPPRLE